MPPPPGQSAPSVDEGDVMTPEPNGSSRVREGAYFSPRSLVAPPVSGIATDIRYPSRRVRLRPAPLAPTSKVESKRTPARAAEETPLTLPHAARNGDAPAQLPPSSGAAPAPVTPIDNYRVLTSSVATGAAPMTIEAISWLKSEGFKTIVNLLPESQADMAEGSEVRRAGMDYISLPMTPETLDAEAVRKFNEIIDDAARRPIYLHDSTGELTGAMWYLHAVLVDKLADTSARRLAARIGLEDPPMRDLSTKLWLAVQKHLAAQK
jgi:protein tyrosine phosphatase (PTP) superfamily phosphohydrolase (DUF442 family)